MPSLSKSSWLGFDAAGQLSALLFTPSPSLSGSVDETVHCTHLQIDQL